MANGVDGKIDRTSQDILESKFNVAGIKGGRLDERQMVLACRSDWSVKSPWFVGPQDELANPLASSVGTALRCLKSLLLPTSMMTMFASAWSRSSFSHLVTFSYVWCLLIS